MARKSLMHNYIYFETLEAGPHRKIAGRTALEQASRRRCRTRARSAPNNSASAARELTRRSAIEAPSATVSVSSSPG